MAAKAMRSPNLSDLAKATSPGAALRESLRHLEPSGKSGLEGLVCELLTALTGRRFFLAAAGSQQGRDGSTGGIGGTWTAVECKRYRQDGEFDRRDLLGGLVQLTLSTYHPDLWVLIASTAVPEQVVSELKAASSKLGVAFDVLDTPEDGPGDLELLCASYPETTLRFVGEEHKFELKALREHIRCSVCIESLRTRFSIPALGFDHAQHRSYRWFREGLESPEEARARLGGQPLALRSTKTAYTPRAQAAEWLDSWWNRWADNPRTFILLGEEGVGKTWAVAAWADHLISFACETILLFVPSANIATTDPANLIAACLTRATGSDDDSLWAKRIRSWIDRSTTRSAVFLLILDGINERPTFPWRDLFDHLLGYPWRDRVAVLVTCRPLYWNNSLFMPEQESEQQELHGFSEEELERALQACGRRVDDFPAGLIPMLRKPRYLSLALKHYKRLEETGDFTIDRLLYEDWKDRLARKRGLTLNDESFRSLLAQLAKDYRQGRIRYSLRDLETLLPRDKATDLHELVTGGLIEVDSALVNPYIVERKWLSHGLGLLLASELNQPGTQVELEEELAHFLEPHIENEQQTDIVAAACLFSVFTPDYSRSGKQVLFAAWVGRQNHSWESVEHLKAYVPLAVDDYLTLLEHSTLTREFDHRAVERLEHAVLSWRSLARIEAKIIEYASRWLSFVNPAGFPYTRPHQGSHAEYTEEALAKLAALKETIENRLNSLPPHLSLLTTQSDCFIWLSDSALFFLSSLADRHRVAPLRQWSLSRSVMGSSREWNQVCWLLRRTASHDFENSFFEEAEALLADPSLVVRRAGGELLSCLASSRAVKCWDELPVVEQRILENRDLYSESDPCIRGLTPWRREDCEECAKREDLDDVIVLRKISFHALDPSFQIPEAAVQRSSRALGSIDPRKVWGSFATTSAEHALESIEPCLAISQSELLADFYRRVVRTQACDAEGWKAVAHCLERVQPLLTRTQERGALATRWQSLRERVRDKNDQLIHGEIDLFAATIANRPAAEQIAFLLQRPAWAFDSVDLLDVYSSLGEAEVAKFIESLLDSTSTTLERKLSFLLAQPSLLLKPPHRQILLELVDLADRVRNGTPSRLLVTQVILRSGDEQLWEDAMVTRRLRPADVSFYRDRWRGDERLLGFRSALGYSELRESVDIATLGYLLVANGRSEEALSSYAEDIDAALSSEAAGQSDPFHPRFRVEFSIECIRELLQRHSDVCRGWIERVLLKPVDRMKSDFLKSTWPVHEALCEALFLERDARASDFYEALKTASRQKDPFFQDHIGDSLPYLLFRIESEAVRSHRDGWYSSCWGDRALLEFATVARSNGWTDYLIDLVERGTLSLDPIERAKAVSLAGWCGVSRAIRSRLECIDEPPGSWLASLKEQAFARIRREEWARTWFTKFLTSHSEHGSFAAFRLFLRCVDRRYDAWRDDVFLAHPLNSARAGRRLRFLTTNSGELETAIKKSEKDLHKYFLYLAIPETRMVPWTGLASSL